ncbi:MAG TPA: hypothetical protein VGO47_13540 [Chlamydiales bacterium]|jgi:hypothetical protein|nr:hypothetical protein [Chlamydiales bacterium]
MRQKISENDDQDVEREVQERLRDIEDLEEYFAAKSRTGSSREKRRNAPRNAHNDQSPPQTALNRVIRELQDDFTHYKR